MSKRISKKILYLFLVATTLLQFGSASPMLKEISDCSDPREQPSSNGTKITDLPRDCVHEILKFHTSKDKKNSYKIKKLLELRLVCKDFKQGVRSFPGPLSFSFENRKIISLGNVFDNVEQLSLNHCDFKSLSIAWPTNLRSLGLYKCRNIDNISIPKANNLRELTVSYCDKFNGKGLAGLTNLCKLIVQSCHNFKGSGLEKLINLHTLTVMHCLYFDWGKLEKLTNLHTLVMSFNHSLDMKELGKLTKLRKLSVQNCHHFEGRGLKKLTKLRKLEVSCCYFFDENSDAVNTLKKNGCKVTVTVND